MPEGIEGKERFWDESTMMGSPFWISGREHNRGQSVLECHVVVAHSIKRLIMVIIWFDHLWTWPIIESTVKWYMRVMDIPETRVRIPIMIINKRSTS